MIYPVTGSRVVVDVARTAQEVQKIVCVICMNDLKAVLFS